MLPSFSPEHYLHVAKELYAQQDLGEAGLRACMSRAYYAAFLVARDVANLDYRNNPNSHELVISHYQESKVAAHNLVANDLRSLKEHRKKADYFTDKICARREGGESLRLSEKVIRVLRP
ncbi:HEPN domain-containing protein [Comamonas sp. Tr-654]|uniref:HEPN domain-containing protein n=1 Tax=Comamonas sp. Tr-654 TaxID=2608341 RepID=UPI0014237784|nr:HEPN domain-containing protein [Comamonas sp. Tr-654]NIF85270.1 HEPN domain-containing protein [Comamonas sp. Tr-654]